MKKNHPPRGGFTLVELIVASAVMAIILSGAYLSLQVGLRSQKTVESRLDAAQSARVVLAMLAADLRTACPLGKDFEFLGARRPIGGLEASNLDFVTHNHSPAAPGEGDLCEVSYYADRHPRTGRLGLWRRRDPSLDDDPLSGGSREEIVPDLAGFEVEYSDGFFWYTTWGLDPQEKARRGSSALLPANYEGLPEAVRIAIALGEPFAGEGTSGDAASLGGEKREPKTLVFQTTVRLNLAGRAARSGSGASSGTTGTGESGAGVNAEGGK